MNYRSSTHALNVDVHWLTLTRAELLAALSTASGRAISQNAIIDVDSDGDVWLEWHTPKAPKAPV